MLSDINPPVLAIYAILAAVVLVVVAAPLQVVLRSFLGRPAAWRFERIMANRPSSARRIKADPDYVAAQRSLEKLNNAKFVSMVAVLLLSLLGSLRYPKSYFDSAYKVPALPRTLDELSAAAMSLAAHVQAAGAKAGLVHLAIGLLVSFLVALVLVNVWDFSFAFLGYLVDRVRNANDYARTSAKVEKSVKRGKTGELDKGESSKLELPNYYELLGLPVDAPIPALSTLLDAQEQTMQQERASGRGTKKLRRQLDLVTDARETLLDHDRRMAYHQALGLQTTAPQQMETLKVRKSGESANSRVVSDEQRERMEQMKRKMRGKGEGL